MLLLLHPDLYSVCRLDACAEIPWWAFSAQFVSMTRTGNELSVVCRQDLVPEGTRAEKGWMCFEVAGVLDFSLTGIMADLSGILAKAKISLFVVSSYDTDFILVKQENTAAAIAAFTSAGHTVTRQSGV